MILTVDSVKFLHVCPVEGETEHFEHQIKMFALIGATLLFAVSVSSADTGLYILFSATIKKYLSICI